MALVPAGPFMMGREINGASVVLWHEIYLDSFYVDVLEVSSGRYAAFLNDVGRHVGDDGAVWARIDPLLGQMRVFRQEDGHYLPVDANLPAAHVSWPGAREYCEWAGLRLPTEAEWEKAARATDGRTYPWGEVLEPTRANYGSDDGVGLSTDDADGYHYTGPVGSYPLGASPYGALDMAGNVSEWVSDRYWSGYYPVSPYENPQGPDTAPLTGRSVRGGSYLTLGVQTWFRKSHGGGNLGGELHWLSMRR
jgi:formylglycine-generating enzyme required for sulfatase activity